MRHPNERGRQRELRQVVFLAVREALNAPAHPDSKRQERSKRRDLERYGARVLKESRVLSCPPVRCNKRREVRDMQRRLAEDRKRLALHLSLRLQGKGHLLTFTKTPPALVDAFTLLAHLQQEAAIAMGVGGLHAGR